MAHFFRQSDNKRISGETISVPAGQTVGLALWGYEEARGRELDIKLAGPGIADFEKDKKGNRFEDSGAVRKFRLIGKTHGMVRLEAKSSSGAVWDYVLIGVARTKEGSSLVRPAGEPSTAPASGRKYTNNSNEVVTQTTTPTPRQVVNLLLSAWTALTNNGARTLTAQFMHETGGGTHCYNWNIGNVKAGPNEPHMYLHGVWECSASAQAEVERANGLAHLATAEEIRKHGYACSEGKVPVVFQPPHVQCRFRAYSSLQDGAQRWVRHHQGIAQRDPNFVTALNAGNNAAVAHALGSLGARYYTGDEAAYARGMTRWRAEIDRQLGPLP